ncbi:membrane protein [Labrenzia sp. C1B10]|nr:membrane protein [Labrenzia sp. C1B10]ERS03212.1 membrane protein [Labrenzia sp. C1B70]
MEEASLSALWWAVIASGLYHGVNPGMGWPLAVSAALMEQRALALPRALLLLAVGHLAAMLVILLPFSAMITLVSLEQEIRIGAACLVIGMGLYLLIADRHPRFLARISPAKLGLWSFLVAIAHGAGLMLVPIYLGICAMEQEAGHAAAGTLMGADLRMALLVAAVHTLAMALAGGLLAIGVYFWLGLRFLQKAWFNLDRVWAASLVFVGLFALVLALRS